MLAIFAPLLCGVGCLLLPRKALGLRVALASVGPIAALALLIQHARAHGFGPTPEFAWMPAVQLNLSLNADKLGVFFALLVAGIGLLVVLYARAYFGPDRDSLYRFYPTLLLFMTAMIGVALSDNLMLMLLFWEMTSISSFLLIGWERDDPTAVKKAMQAFVTTAAGGLALMGGLIMLGVLTEQWTFTGLIDHAKLINGSPGFVAAFVLIFIGAAAKSAQFPLHFWLPGAMAAPTPVSAYLHSATMVKAGVYLTGRFWPILISPTVAVHGPLKLLMPLVVVTGAITMVYGAYVALRKTDLKQIFAYTTVSQLGLLMTMYGLAGVSYKGEPNLLWDVTQILNHALYKAPLFIVAGAIGHVAATRELPQLRGYLRRGRTEAIMTVVLLLAAYAMAAGPGTLSFSAKEFFFYQIDHAQKATGHPAFWVLAAAGVATATFNTAIFVRLFVTLVSKPEPPPGHRGPVEEEAHDSEVDENVEAEAGHAADAHGHHHAAHHEHHHEKGFWPVFLWLPGALVVSLQYLGGFLPGVFEAMFGFLEPNARYFEHIPSFVDALQHPSVPLAMSLAGMTLGVLLGFSPLLRRTFADPFDGVYPGFYTGVTKIVGPRSFGLVQTGHARFYVAVVATAITAIFFWAAASHDAVLRWPEGLSFEAGAMLPGLLLIAITAAATVLMVCVNHRVTRVLVLGAVGFAVAGIYYLYRAPDLALTQISIEIVSLVLFLVVLTLLPDEHPRDTGWIPARVLVAMGIGFTAFWMTLISSVGPQPTMPYANVKGQPHANLGEYFLRNTAKGWDSAAVPKVYGGTVDRGVAHRTGFNYPEPKDAQAGDRTLHKGGGGNNAVNVILMDFRGFDTMGEITVLGIAALGVWTLLRRRRTEPKGATP